MAAQMCSKNQSAMIDKMTAELKNITLSRRDAARLRRAVKDCLLEGAITKRRQNHCSICREMGILTPGKTKRTHGQEGHGH